MDNEKLGQAIDRVENLMTALQMPLPDGMHVQVLRSTLPEIVQELKEGFVEAAGENPWE